MGKYLLVMLSLTGCGGILSTQARKHHESSSILDNQSDYDLELAVNTGFDAASDGCEGDSSRQCSILKKTQGECQVGRYCSNSPKNPYIAVYFPKEQKNLNFSVQKETASIRCTNSGCNEF